MAQAQSNQASTNPTPNSVVECKVSATRRVSYLFKTGQWSNPLQSEVHLVLPYVLAIDGKVHKNFAKTVGRLRGQVAKDDIFVEPGQTVSLYLNTDALPDRRNNALFAVTPTENDVEVVILEKRGHLGDDDTPKLKETKEVNGPGGCKRKVDVYEATLTGDIWLKVSHKYTLEEAMVLIPATTEKSIRDAVLTIYDATVQGPLNVSIQNEKGETQSIRLSFQNADNPIQNISNFNMYRDGLPRVHPEAWTVVIEAGLKAGVTKVLTTSAWRPMFGSIAHRTGLALDVGTLDTIQLNRGELRSNGPDLDWVTEDEKTLLAEKESAEHDLATARNNYKKLQAEDKKLQALKKSHPTQVNPLREAALPAELTEAETKLKEAEEKRRNADKAWNDERDAHEPNQVKLFRAQLNKCECVSQVFDPWFMNTNTHDAKAREPNLQIDGNETLHRNHLHVTIHDSNLSGL